MPGMDMFSQPSIRSGASFSAGGLLPDWALQLVTDSSNSSRAVSWRRDIGLQRGHRIRISYLWLIKRGLGDIELQAG